MAVDDPFEPKLGKIRAKTPKASNAFRSQVLKAAQRAGGMKGLGKGSRKGASLSLKFGRGAGVGRVLSSALKKGANHRRVVVKTRFVKLAGKGLKAAAAHLSYIQRDGVTREGQPGVLYGPDTDLAEGRAFMERSEGDRHQFRFIVAPEDSLQYEDLKPLTRKLMTQMEADLGTKLDWVAVDHFNTGHPHTHIILRGRDDTDKDLVIAREYLSAGFRERAEAQVTLDLGPRSDHEISTGRQAEVTQERFTSIDRQLLKGANDLGQVSVSHSDPATHAWRVGRLRKLQSLGLAEEVGEGHWQLRPDMEGTLRQMGERGDIIKALHHELKARHKEQALADSVIHGGEALSPISETVTGRLLKRGLADEHSDRHFLILEATDGRVHYVDVGQGDRLESLGVESLVRVTPKVPEVKAVDRTILEVAKANGGYYDIGAHQQYDRGTRRAFAETHMRRLEAIRRTTGGVDREPDGRFKIGPDYLDKALAYERHEAHQSPVTVEIVSTQSLNAQIKRQGVTWLDREWDAGTSDGYVDTGFGAEAKAALRLRQQWLLKEGLANETPEGQIVAKEGLIQALHRREMTTIATGLAKETGLRYTEARSGEMIEGKLRQSVTLGSGKFAVIERAKDFILVPWRPVLEKHMGKDVSGMMRESGINWSIGHDRGMDMG